MRNKVLDVLKANKGQFISGENISEKLGISRTAVWKHVGKLREEGYIIESQTNGGYKLIESPDILSLSELEPFLRTSFIGRDIIFLDSISSTNTYAKKKAEESFREGTVIIADEQTEGKGRLGRQWISARRKGIWMSVMLKPDILPVDAPKLTIVAAIAVVRALWSCCQLKAGIKWPNDITVGNKKICGILTEMSAEADEIKYVIIGIGINTNVEIDDFGPEVSAAATSVSIETGRAITRKALTASVLYELEDMYEDFIIDGSIRPFLNEYKGKSAILGRNVKAISKKEEITGLATDISEEGHLIVRLSDGTYREIVSGEISVRGLCGYI